MNLEDKTILIVSNEPWGDIWYSKHNYAFELSQTNRVIFIDPPGRWRPGNFLRSKVSMRQEEENLFVLSYENRLPSQFYHLNKKKVSKTIRQFLLNQGISETFLWSFDPLRVTDPEILGCTQSVFHIVDKYQQNHPGEFDLVRNASAFIAVSERVTAKIHDKKPTLIVPHGISSREFAVDQVELASIEKELPDNFGLYVGMIDRRLDYEALESLLQRTTIPLVFVGKLIPQENEAYWRIFNQKKYPHLHFIGPKPFRQLKNYIHLSSFCLAPMDLKVPGNAISHHKTFQYLAMGKPVFCPPFSEYNEINHLMYVYENADQMVNDIISFSQNGEDKTLRRKRIEFAKSNTFEVHLENIRSFLAEIG